MNLEERINRINIEFLERDCKPPSKNKVQQSPEETVREIIRYFIYKDYDGTRIPVISRHALKREIIRLKKCDMIHVNRILNEMDLLGFEYCIEGSTLPSDSLDGTPIYNIVKFAELRGYVTDQESKDLKIKSFRF
jgi:hypothetical protein